MPTGVKILAVLAYIAAALAVIGGIGFIFGGAAIGNLIAQQVPFLGAIGSAFFVVGGIITIALGVLYFFVGKGLWRGQNWARILTIIFACLGVLSAIAAITQGQGGYVGLVVNAVIGGYLLFSKSVKAAFA